jgi:uncharacterized protein DUF2011
LISNWFIASILNDYRSVTRKDLDSSDPSDHISSDDESLENVVREKLGDVELEFIDAPPTEANINDEVNHSQSQDLEFRLFAGPSESNATRIKITSPEFDNRPPGFVVPNRPDSYYFRGELSNKDVAAFDACAVSGADVLTRSNTPWPGCFLPWRVIRIKQSAKETSMSNVQVEVNEPINKPKRSRLGKKARIAKRKIIVLKREQIAKKETALKEKEAHLREKRSKKNRSQKLKRREKKRATKAAMAIPTTDSVGLSSPNAT